MPRTSKPPAYRRHAPSGRAVVTLTGQDHYLGPHGTTESRVAYEELVARWLAGNCLATLEADYSVAGWSEGAPRRRLERSVRASMAFCRQVAKSEARTSRA